MKKLKLLAVVGALGLIQGCVSLGEDDYSCPGPGKGVTCSNAMQVYEMTNDYENAREILRQEKARATGHEDHTEYVDVKVSPHDAGDKILAVSQPVPVLKPAEVIRIWIAPWTDEKHDLHWPGYVFSEITPRRWTFGEREIKDTRILTPVPVKK